MNNIIIDNITIKNKVNFTPVEPHPDNTNLLQAAGDLWFDATDKELKLYNGTTTVDILDSGDTWDDLRAPATGINPAGSVAPPTVNTTDGSLEFSTNDAVCVWFQLPHKWKEGTELHPHIHWAKSSSASGIVNWQMKYKWANKGEVMPAFSSLTSGTVQTADDDTANKHAQIYFPAIDGTGKKISSMLCIYLIRTATGDTYGSDAYLYEIDLHYIVDSIGSKIEYLKS